MKKLGTLILLALCFFGYQADAQDERYIDEIFTDVDVVTDVTYGTNITVLTVAVPGIEFPTQEDLKMDVYMPAGDTETDRPLLINVHTGNFLPPVVNQGVNGTRTDSFNLEIAMRFARMGYVVANIDYRLGWDPSDPTIEGRVSGLINAAYRGIQDSRTAVRFFRQDAIDGDNVYGICPERVSMIGNGTGGYVVLGAATIQNYSEMVLPKFFNPDGTPMVFDLVNGDPFATSDGIPIEFPGTTDTTTLCIANHVGYSSDVAVAINVGGALGDSSWISTDDASIIGFQTPLDEFAPYETDILTVPTTGDLIVEVSGSYDVCRIANSIGLNDQFLSVDDEFTDAANMWNDGYEGLFPLNRPCNPDIFPPNDLLCEGAPWEWWDADFWSQIEHPVCIENGLPVQVCNYHIIASRYAPMMSATQGRTYCDTIVGYSAPRLYIAMDLGNEMCSTGTNDVLDATAVNLTIAPNPAVTEMRFNSDETMETIEIYNFAGQLMSSNRVNANRFVLNRNDLSNGMYIAKIQYEGGIVSKKVVFN